MLDALMTPWSGHRGLPLPTVLPSAPGVPAQALVEVATHVGARTGATPSVVLVTPWWSYRLPTPRTEPAEEALSAAG